MRTRTIGAILAAALTLGACGDEGPVGIESLVPEDLIQTFEVVLDAARFLTVDTTIGDFVDLDDLDYLLVAEDFGGALDAHSLMRFQVPVSFPVPPSPELPLPPVPLPPPPVPLPLPLPPVALAPSGSRLSSYTLQWASNRVKRSDSDLRMMGSGAGRQGATAPRTQATWKE